MLGVCYSPRQVSRPAPAASTFGSHAVSLLLSVVFKSVCQNTHHRIAVDALRHLRLASADDWCDLLLCHHAAYLAGSVAPDEQFKDFQNHVWLVGHDGWGGAAEAARRWYRRLVDALKRQQWHEAAHAAGVVSHYVSDVCLPLNTAVSEESATIQRAVEWSVSHAYGELQQILEHDLGGYPQITAARCDDWLARLMRQGAELAHEHYKLIIDHYDIARALKDPTAGMDQQCKDSLARCLGLAVASVARVLERAIEQSAAAPPNIDTTIQGFLTMLTSPLRWTARQVSEMNERLAVEAIYDELQRDGKVKHNLPEEVREVRQLYGEEVLGLSLSELDARPLAPLGIRYGEGQPPRYRPNRLIVGPPSLNLLDAANPIRRPSRAA